MRLDRRDFADRAFYFGEVDHAFVRDVARLALPGETVIDLGAQKGYHAMLLARAVGRSGTVVAVEPDPRAAALLAEHCTRNGLTQVRIVPAAAGDAEGSAAFSLNTQIGWSSRFPNPTQRRGIAESITVPVRTVDGIARELGPVPISFVKMDIEGSEPRALRGMGGVLAAHAPIMWMEVNAAALAAAGEAPAAVDAIILPLGYRIFRVDWTSPVIRRRRILYREAASVESLVADAADGEFDVVLVSPRYADRFATVGPVEK